MSISQVHHNKNKRVSKRGEKEDDISRFENIIEISDSSDSLCNLSISSLIRPSIQNFHVQPIKTAIQGPNPTKKSPNKTKRIPNVWKGRKRQILKYEVSNGEFNCSLYEGRSLITYQIAGTSLIKYVSENHLKYRVVTEKKDQKTSNVDKCHDKSVNDHQSSGQILVGQEQQDPQQFKQTKRRLRYFDIISPRSTNDYKCSQCGKKGHISKHCFQYEERKQQIEQKQQKICQLCCSRTHTEQQCKKIGGKCKRCRKYGHPEQECGIILVDHMSQDYLLVCLSNCKQPMGHYNCHIYETIPPKVYISQPSLHQIIGRYLSKY